ncbi:MAG: sugar phosphate isomerase/epimerase [Thermomicrobiales bacterium]|nr:sugar phosphate isomerase/epimerase [Thermomicrobiales bacterium]
MDLGIFETTFPRPTPEAALDAVGALGLGTIQFDFVSAGLPSLPDAIPASLAERIGHAAATRGIRIAAVSATWNMIHPDPHVRERGLSSLRAIAGACAGLGADAITLCTGTRDPDNMWRSHPDNATPQAWRDLRAALTDALAIAAEFDVALAFEPEPANVVANAVLGARLLREVGDPRLMVVMDPANILAGACERPPADALDEAFALLGERVVVGHAKDLDAQGRFCAAGTGIVPWERCLAAFRQVGFAGSLILHSLNEEQAPIAVAYLRERMAQAGL